MGRIEAAADQQDRFGPTPKQAQELVDNVVAAAQPDATEETAPLTWRSYPEPLINQVYMIYILLGGHVARTAAAAQVPEEIVEQLAAKEDWNRRLDIVGRLSTPEGVGRPTVERLLNRALTYVQMQRIRRICDKVIEHFEYKLAKQDPEFLKLFTSIDKEGNAHVDLKPLHDLAKAAQTANVVAQTALCDTSTERACRFRKQGPEPEAVTLGLGLSIAKGLDSLAQQEDAARAKAAAESLDVGD